VPRISIGVPSGDTQPKRQAPPGRRSTSQIGIVQPPSPELEQTVAATFQTGYRYKGVLVRPARVQVYSGQGNA